VVLTQPNHPQPTDYYTQLFPQQKKIWKMKFQMKHRFTQQQKFYTDSSPHPLKQFSSDLVEF